MRTSRAAAGVMVIAGLFASACTGGKDRASPRPSPSPQRASFVAAQVRGLDTMDRPEAQVIARRESKSIIRLINAYYDTAFVDPKKWAGKHKGLATYFSQEAAPTVPQSIDALALTDLAKHLKLVSPTVQSIRGITIHLEPDLTAPMAVATISFEAIGATKVKAAAGPLKITHTATFWLLKESNQFKISAYQIDMSARPVRKPSPTPARKKRASFGVPS